MVAAETMVMLFLKRAGVDLAGDLILAAGADEETGGEYGFGWLAKHAPDRIQADFAINEGGGGPIIPGSQPIYGIANGEKGRLEVHITLEGISCHAASPWQGDNVSFKLAKILTRLENRRPEIDVSHPVFDALTAHLQLETPITPDNVDAVADEVAATNVGMASLMRGMSRMTLVPTMFEGGVKSNSIPASGKLICDVRTLPHQDEAYVRREVEGVLAEIEGASYELVYTAVPSASPASGEFVDAIKRATELAIDRPVQTWLPTLCTGFTDARLVRPLDVNVYGYGAGHPDRDPSVRSGAHGVDESVDLASYLTMIKMLLALAYDVLGAKGSLA
jgi:acetylornithine deacetylase/succinyl-diaminopimelate desuccinylase-like protein